MIKTTLNEIRGFGPCGQEKGCGYGFDKLLSHLGKTEADDEPLPLVTVLDSNGLNDAIWCLRVCPDVAAKFARWCADRADDAAESADWHALWAAYWADMSSDSVNFAASNAALAARAAGYASSGAARSAGCASAGAAERRAQADKLREMIS